MNEIKFLFNNFYIYFVFLKYILFVGIDCNCLKIVLILVFDGLFVILLMCDVVFDKLVEIILYFFIDKRVLII